MLIGLETKNAILIVEFGVEMRRERGMSILESAKAASRERLRPILMTSFAFGLGVVPLVLATGAGANGRISLGLSVLSGIIASTCLAVLFVPSFFALWQGFEEWRKARKKTAVPAARPAE
jgi:HAE1 family hydrophobic/amphiphilic exporter-1